MLNFLYTYLKLINFWFLGLGNGTVIMCKINGGYSRLFLISSVPVIQPVSLNTDWIIGGYSLNMWWILISGCLFFFIVGVLVFILSGSKIISECILGTYYFFLCYWVWFFNDQIFPGLGDKWIKKLQDLKVATNIDSSSGFLLLDICYKNPPLFIICIGMLIIPLSFFIYSILTAVSFLDKYNLKVLSNLNHWTNIFGFGLLSQFYAALIGVDLLFFSDGLSLWLLNVHKRLWLSSISIVVLLYYFSVFYRIMSSYGYLSRITLIMTRIFEKYTINIWKKRMFALLIASTLYIVVVLYGSGWSYPFNLLVDWVELVAIFSFFIFSWELPSFGFF